MSDLILPKRRRGRPTAKGEAEFQKLLLPFCAQILNIWSSLDFAVGSRDYCYLLEEHGLRKGDFDAAQKLINDLRKSGDLPLDLCCEDGSRAATGVEEVNDNSIGEEVENWIDHLRDVAHSQYLPISIWDDLPVYVEVGVEKLGLRNMFRPVCREFHVPITNFKGWSDLNSRAAMMRRFKEHEAVGRKCALLLFTDHDPGGLHIADSMRKNLEDLAKAVGWSPDNLVIIGLDADFIDDNALTWIDNLETSSGGQLDDEDHNDHDKAYVQDYIDKFGVKKCEANALVTKPELGRQLCRDAVLEHVPIDIVRHYEEELAHLRAQLQQALRERVS